LIATVERDAAAAAATAAGAAACGGLKQKSTSSGTNKPGQSFQLEKWAFARSAFLKYSYKTA